MALDQILKPKQSPKRESNTDALVYRIETMSIADVPEVAKVEARCFTNPWPPSAYRRELRLPGQNYYVVLRSLRAGPDAAPDGRNGHRGLPRLLPFARRNGAENRIVGFAGMWTVYDEAHITTIGVDPDLRGRGLGEWLLVHLIEEAITRNASWLTLEVRVSNQSAQSLYEKYGFTVHGTRKRYYSDNDEDAYIMWSPSLQDTGYLARFRQLYGTIASRFPNGVTGNAPPVNGPSGSDT